jgi:ligand-binding sensor domain-containing protein
MRAKLSVRATFAALSPAGSLWVGLRIASGAGEAVGRGAVEIDLSSGRAIEHRPLRPEEHASPEALPLPANLTDILFDGSDTWYTSIGGISRWQEGQLRTWSENEGLASELVHAIGRGPDGALWAGTSQGLVRFDGKDWRPLGSSEIAARGIATDGKRRVWIATSKGLRMLEPTPAPATVDPDQAPVILPGDMRDVTVDRQGRVWAMSSTTIALVADR